MTAAASTTVRIRCVVNGANVEAGVSARQHLADFLRDDLGLTGTHLGCEHGVCGACTVRINGAVVRGCLVLAAQMDGQVVDTIEGLSESGELAPLQAAFTEHNSAQCGYCTPGMLLTAHALLNDPALATGPVTRQVTGQMTGQLAGLDTRQVIREYISGNFCRCTGYQSIVDAIDSLLGASLGGTPADE